MSMEDLKSIDRVCGMHMGLHRPSADGAGICLQRAGRAEKGTGDYAKRAVLYVRKIP